MTFRVVIMGLPEIADTEEAVSFDRLREHLSIARLEDVKRQRPVWEKDGVGEENDPALFRNFQRIHELVGLGESLIEVGEDVVDVFDANRQADEFRTDAAGQLLF